MTNTNNIHREIHFESEIVEHLLNNGWVGGESNPKSYDVEKALIPEDVLQWVQVAYPSEWDKLKSIHGDQAESVFVRKLVEQLDRDGCLNVLRHGFKIVGAGSTYFRMMSSKPAFDLNEEELELYSQNICRIVRQVHYSPFRRAESIDLVAFVNGIPVATFELKTDSTQSVHHAIAQYCNDRPPADPKTKHREPLLQFKTRCLVHFAVSTDEVHMATQLDGSSTFFLPFNVGYEQGAGNPPNEKGIKTSYLWEDVLDRDAWLHILSRFIHLEVKKKPDENGKLKKKETLIFPRFHQWRAVTRLVSQVKDDGAGHRYLIQHSAGSGKSNSIAWLAHHLSNLHRSETAKNGNNGVPEKAFHSVIVVTDRTVLDKQLQETIYQFEHKHGVVECITEKGGSKSAKLGEALEKSKPVIIVTIQTFGFVMEHLSKNTALRDRNFAIIVDEAHTSQTGSSASKLKQALSKNAEEGEELSAEDILLEEMTSQAGNRNVSYFAFTATPKPKTMELFGTVNSAGGREPFDSYSMQQAIEEGYILDVLQNYTNYKVAWKLAHEGRDYDDQKVDKSEGSRKLVRWVRLHPYNIAQKVAIIVEHFREHVAWRLDYKAKAMIVTSSRQEVVRYKIAIDKYIRENNYPLATLVAFSGNVVDHESGPEEFTERSMNPKLKGTDIREAFDGDEYQLLLVANKFQTGFDQPKLVAMYLDKKLGGVATVQTLSRLNRKYPGKDWTVVLDFVNKPEDILTDFQQYYRAAVLPNGSDPELLLRLQDKLDKDGFYLESEVEAFAVFYWSLDSKIQRKTHAELQRLITPALQRFRDRVKQAMQQEQPLEDLELLVKDITSYVKLYEFFSQILDYQDTDLLKRYVFFKHLLHPLREILRVPEKKDVIDLTGVKLTHLAIREGKDKGLKLSPDGQVADMTGIYDAGTGQSHDKEKEALSEIIQKLNDLFEGELTDQDMVSYFNSVANTMLKSEELKEQAKNNSLDQFAQGGVNDYITDAIIEQRGNNNQMAGQLLSDQRKLTSFTQLMVKAIWEGFENMRKAG